MYILVFIYMQTVELLNASQVYKYSSHMDPYMDTYGIIWVWSNLVCSSKSAKVGVFSSHGHAHQERGSSDRDLGR